MQDRKRLLSLPICPDAHSNLPPLPPNPPGGAGSMGILVSSNNNANNGASCSGSIMVKMVSYARSKLDFFGDHFHVFHSPSQY